MSYFFKSSWLAQLIVGIALFLCSFFLEYQILRAFVAPALLALFLTITLEIGKVTAIVWHYYLDHFSFHTYPGSVRFISSLFRAGLLILSLLCSQLFLTARLDRPNLEAVRARDLATVEQRFDEEASRLDGQLAVETAALTKRQQAEMTEQQHPYRQRIEQLETLLLGEMDNVVNGRFRGPRYEEFDRRLTREKAAFGEVTRELRQRHAGEREQLRESFTGKREALAVRAAQARDQVAAKDYSTNEQANDPHITAFLKVVDSIFHATLQPLQFVFVFSILVSGLMEAGIMLSFALITVSMAPVLAAQHKETVEKETLMARVGGESERDELRHGAAMERVRSAGERIVRQAEARIRRQRCES